MKYRNWNIAIALMLSIGAQAHAANTGDDDFNRSMQAGVCAVYLDYLKMDKKWSDKAWKKAPEITMARIAAQQWQHGMSRASNTVQTSYLIEGEQGCMAINALPGDTK
jgi:hypothetical protein